MMVDYELAMFAVNFIALAGYAIAREINLAGWRGSVNAQLKAYKDLQTAHDARLDSLCEDMNEIKVQLAEIVAILAARKNPRPRVRRARK